MVLRYDEDPQNPTSFSPLNSHEYTEEAQTTGRPSSSGRSHLQDPDHEQPPRNINEDDEDNLSYVSDILLPLPITSNVSFHTEGSDCTDSAEEDSIDCDNEENASTNRQGDEVNAEIFHSTLHGFDILGTENSFYSGRTNLGSLQTSRRMQGISPPVTEVADQSLNSPRNLRDTVEVLRMNASVTLSQIHEISPNTNVQNRENHGHPQTTFRNSGDREMDRLSREHSAIPSAAAPLRLGMSSIAPNITLLRENLDLVLHTLSMQRQPERRNLENIVQISQNKVAEKPKTDPEKLKKLQER